MSAHTSRRQRLRQATLEEIHAAAHKLLVEQGSAAVAINAVAQQVGMSGPALYHYYAGHDELVGAVTADFFRELAAVMEQARDACAGAPIGTACWRSAGPCAPGPSPIPPSSAGSSPALSHRRTCGRTRCATRPPCVSSRSCWT
jgi:AcrR family transcriptional regulator